METAASRRTEPLPARTGRSNGIHRKLASVSHDRVKNFRRAGEILGLSQAAVSRAIASLEDRLSSRLFHRSTRQFSLTEVAERFYDGCCRILDDLDCLEANAANHGRVQAGVLRLAAHTTATLTWLAPLVASFKRKYSNIAPDITLTERPVDLTADGYDLGIVLPFMLATDLAEAARRLVPRDQSSTGCRPRLTWEGLAASRLRLNTEGEVDIYARFSPDFLISR
ncbi:MAG TPA: LysR family transcriptional regulator [Trinickia sp.]|nr:LysR family transcriptional regulator [Trinickia sp.]